MKTYEFTVKLVEDDVILKIEVKAPGLQEAIAKFFKKTSHLIREPESVEVVEKNDELDS